MIIFGSRLFGKVDHVPGHSHVATQFFHLNFIPLFPTKSWIVLHGTESSGFMKSSWRGIQLRSIRWGSVGMAWLRFGLVICAAVFGLVGAAGLASGRSASSGMVEVLLAVGCGAALFGSYRIARATGESLRKLGSDPGVPAEFIRSAQASLQGRKGASGLVR